MDLIERFAESTRRRRGARVTIRVGINGFGRIGGRGSHPLGPQRRRGRGVNELSDNEHRVPLKYDTVMRVFDKEVTADADSMYVNGKRS